MQQKKPLSIFFILLVTGFITPTACVTSRSDAGYFRTQQRLTKTATDSLKASIRTISNDVFKPYQYTGHNNITINYRLLAPEQVNGKDRYPLVLVLHGSGAIGTDNTSQLGILAKLWAQPAIREKYPAYVVAPQFPQRSSNYALDSTRNVLVSTPDACLSTALQLIDSLKKVLPVNDRKVYVIGFSMGGSGTINAIVLRPDLFTAGVAISGIPAFNQLNTLAQTPIWIIHGNADTENPINTDLLLYKELQSLHSRHTRFWEVDSLEHDIYYRLYTGDAIPKWLFRQR